MTTLIDKCVMSWCQAPISGPEHFRDELSRKEFHITGMCQKCQDEVFIEDEDFEYPAQAEPKG